MKIKLPFGIYLFFQLILFILFYGVRMNLPVWVVWFPTIIFIIYLVLIFIILIGNQE